jgi:site-specific recombinase
MMTAVERVWYWTAGVLAGTANNWSAYVQDGYVVCEHWNLWDLRWEEIRRPISDFEEGVPV